MTTFRLSLSIKTVEFYRIEEDFKNYWIYINKVANYVDKLFE